MNASEHVAEIVKALPKAPGVYRYFDKDGTIIYVGKAKNLKNRVSSYFLSNNLNRKTQILVSQICDIEYTVVDSESEALLLENVLIKQLQPKYNILLKDDKGYSYYAEDKDGRVVFNGWNPLSEFNIRLFPRSTAEIRRINLLTAYMGDTHELSSGYPINPGKKGTAAVYSSPFGKSAWRAAKGKAAVGLKGEILSLMDWRNNDGETYTLIRYNVSERTQRVGWVLSRELGREEKQQQEHDPLYDFCQVDVWAIADTYLTDDPDVSQFRQFEVPKETCFTCLGTYKGYAYVEAEVNKKGKFTDGGAIVWGFVPLRDLEIMDPREEQPEIMKKLAGTWYMNGGGEFMPDVMTFAEDGTYTTSEADILHDLEGNPIERENIGGTWKVIACRPRWRSRSHSSDTGKGCNVQRGQGQLHPGP